MVRNRTVDRDSDTGGKTARATWYILIETWDAQMNPK